MRHDVTRFDVRRNATRRLTGWRFAIAGGFWYRPELILGEAKRTDLRRPETKRNPVVQDLPFAMATGFW
jgi:hypothetical protein